MESSAYFRQWVSNNIHSSDNRSTVGFKLGRFSSNISNQIVDIENQGCLHVNSDINNKYLRTDPALTIEMLSHVSIVCIHFFSYA